MKTQIDPTQEDYLDAEAVEIELGEDQSTQIVAREAPDQTMLAMAADPSFLERLDRLSRGTEAMMRHCVEKTFPGDWVLFRQNGMETAALNGGGAARVGTFLQIECEALEIKSQETSPAGVLTITASMKATSRVLRSSATVVTTRSSSDEFTGGSPNHLLASMTTTLRSKAVAIVAGLQKMPFEEIKRIYAAIGRDCNGFNLGKGYSKTERMPEELLGAYQRCVDKANKIASNPAGLERLIKEVTQYTDTRTKETRSFPSFDRGTKDWQFNAWEKKLDALLIKRAKKNNEPRGTAQ